MSDWQEVSDDLDYEGFEIRLRSRYIAEPILWRASEAELTQQGLFINWITEHGRDPEVCQWDGTSHDGEGRPLFVSLFLVETDDA